MKSYFLALTLIATLSGCTSKPQADLAPADQWVREQIAQGASSISQAQTRLHQVNGEHLVVSPKAPVLGSANASALPSGVTVKTVGGPPCVCSGLP